MQDGDAQESESESRPPDGQSSGGSGGQQPAFALGTFSPRSQLYPGLNAAGQSARGVENMSGSWASAPEADQPHVTPLSTSHHLPPFPSITNLVDQHAVGGSALLSSSAHPQRTGNLDDLLWVSNAAGMGTSGGTGQAPVLVQDAYAPNPYSHAFGSATSAGSALPLPAQQHNSSMHHELLSGELQNGVSPMSTETPPSDQQSSHGQPAGARRHSVKESHLSPNGHSRPTQAASATSLFYTAIRPPDLQIEDVASWSLVGRFLALYLRYMHCLWPLVHAPTFSKDLVTRRDLHDRQFRAFIFGLGGSNPDWLSPGQRSKLTECRVSSVVHNRTMSD